MLYRLCPHHRTFHGSAAVGQKIDVAALLFNNTADCRRAHFQDRGVLRVLLAQVFHLDFRRGHHLRTVK